MSSDTAAIVTLVCYALAAAGLIYRAFRRSGMVRNAWLLWVTERLYIGLMCQWRSNRRCPFPARGPAIIIANHRSPMDPLLIWMNNHLGPMRRPARIIGFMMAREYYELPALRWICVAMQSIPVDRDGRDMRPAREALERLKQGHLLGVFPEGAINTGEGVKEGDTGIAWLALHAQVPVYPVYIHNAPVGENMIRPFYTFGRVRISYGDPIDLSSYYQCKKTRAVLTEVTDLLMRRLAQLGGVRYVKDERPSPQFVGEPAIHKLIRPTG